MLEDELNAKLQFLPRKGKNSFFLKNDLHSEVG